MSHNFSTCFTLCVLVRAIEFYSGDFDGYGFFWISTTTMTSLAFEVRACKDVVIILSEVTGVEYFGYSYVIGIGRENKQSFISEGTHTVTIDTPDILSCDVYRQFWVSWFENEVNIETYLH